MKKTFRALAALAILAALLVPNGGGQAAPAQAAGTLGAIQHWIVIYQENWSFDSLYPDFPGANGLAGATGAAPQVDKTGQPYATLPQPADPAKKPPVPDPRFPANLPVAPFSLERYVPSDQKIDDIPVRFYQEQYQIDGGKMDKFVAWSPAAGLGMGFYAATRAPEGRLAQRYTMADNFFHAAFGGSFLNHFWLISATSPLWPNAPAAQVVQLDTNGLLVKDGNVTPDGYAVNTVYPAAGPYPASITDTAQLLPAQTMPTIGDRLSAADVSWAWYSGGWNDAQAGHPDPLFQFHHQPFAYLANYAPGTAARAAHLKDEQDFVRALSTNELPAVSFVKPIGANNEHPGYATLLAGQQHVADLVSAVQASPYWPHTAIIITYDENGGFWDHVAPPSGDRWGPGTRVPTIIISPYAKQGFVDHTQYDTTSILKTLEVRWNLAPLSARDSAATPLTNAFNNAPAVPPTGMPMTGGSDHGWGWIAGLLLLLLLGGVQLRRPAARRPGHPPPGSAQ